MTLRRARGLVAAALLAAAIPLGGPAPAGADPLSACTPSTGTVVAVDFGHWSGPIVRGCGVGAASGYDLLHRAGFTTAGDQHDGPAFVCRIGSGSFHAGAQYPTPSEDPCVVTPPASAYWSFWHAEPGDTTWSYTQLGSMSYHPQPGEVELWRFGATSTDGSTGRPPYSPATLRAAAPPARSTPAATPTHASAPAAAPSTTATTRPAGSPAAATPRATSAAATRTSSPPSASARPSVVAATAAANPPSGSGSAVPAVLGIGGVAVLAAAAGVLAWRRRTNSSAANRAR